VEVLTGLAEDSLDLTVGALYNVTGGTGFPYSIIAIGEDSTTTPVLDSQIGLQTAANTNAIIEATARHVGIPNGVGYHKYTWLEALGPAPGSPTLTVYSDDGLAIPLRRSGITGQYRN
jgi:hypothetical protein